MKKVSKLLLLTITALMVVQTMSPLVYASQKKSIENMSIAQVNSQDKNRILGGAIGDSSFLMEGTENSLTINSPRYGYYSYSEILENDEI